MSQSIYLEPDMVPAVLRRGYTGRKFRAEICESVFIPSDAGTWSGGSRDIYSGVRLADGAAVALTDTMSAPWDDCRRDKTFALAPGVVVIRHSMFCGKDMGLVFYVHPADAVKLLPAPAPELSPLARVVLAYTNGRKSSYNGRDRYGMMCDDLVGAVRYGYLSDMCGPIVDECKANNRVPSRDAWDAAKAECIKAGLLNKAGAITVAGRNAVRAT